MDINLGDEYSIKVIVNKKEYMLKDPTFEDLEWLQKRESELPEDKRHMALVEFITRLGMPEDVSKSLGVLKIKTFTDKLLGALSAKK